VQSSADATQVLHSNWGPVNFYSFLGGMVTQNTCNSC